MASHPILQAIQAHLLRSIPEYLALFALWMFAVIANMPHPDTIEKWLMSWSNGYRQFMALLAILYRWVYDSLQGFLASRHPPPPPPPVNVTSVTQSRTETVSTPAPVPTER